MAFEIINVVFDRTKAWKLKTTYNRSVPTILYKITQAFALKFQQ